jgi:hypothetical protein
MVEVPITFDRSDHLESVPHLGQYPLVVDPIVGMKWLTKVLKDEGSDLNIMYTETLDAMGIDRSRIQRLELLSMASCRGSRPSHSGRLTYQLPLRIRPTLGQRPSPSKWLDSTEPTIPS